MVYNWKTASHISADPQKAGELCEELEKTVGLTAKTLLDANRAEDAPLHSEFEWNDSIAGEKYRESQARHIINCLVINVPNNQEEQEPVRAYFNIIDSTYENVNTILCVEDKHSSLLKIAIKELEAFQRKYATLTELQVIFDEIRRLSA